jgi:hypothetical protein
MDQLVADLEAKLAAARAGGGPKAAERMRGKGKRLPRERCGAVCLTSPRLAFPLRFANDRALVLVQRIRAAATW